jgi:hypothetical protein
MPFACGLRCCVFEGSLAAINAAAPLQPDMVSRVLYTLISIYFHQDTMLTDSGC